MTQSKIHIIGVVPTPDLTSCDDQSHASESTIAVVCDLNSSARQALLCATVIVGSLRQLDLVKPILGDDTDILQQSASPQFIELPKLAQLKKLIEQALTNNERIVVLASGDPLYYGIGAWFIRNIGAEQLAFHPASSSIQMACQRVGQSQQDIDVLSLHGRPLEKIRTKLKKGKRLLILTDSASRPEFLAKECIDAGFGESRLTVLEKLGYVDEKLTEFIANDVDQITEQGFDSLHVTLIDVLGSGGCFPEFPGIADTEFSTGAPAGKGMISKREVRLCVLAYLQISDNDVMWDIGAGCGGVSVEAAFWNDNVQIHAIECHEERVKHLAKNCHKFGVSSHVHIVKGRAPESCESLPLPNKIFIGGSDGNLQQLLESAWQILPDNGVLVASAVLDASKRTLESFSKTLEARQTQALELLVKRGDVSDQGIGFEAKLPT